MGIYLTLFSMKKYILFLILAFLIILSFGFAYSYYFQYKEVPLAMIENNPESFNQNKISLVGLVIKNEGALFGPKYELAEFKSSNDFDINSAKRIALGLKAGPSIDLTNFVSYTFDGRNYTKIANKPANVKGKVIYHGPVIDAPQYYLDLETIKLI